MSLHPTYSLLETESAADVIFVRFKHKSLGEPTTPALDEELSALFHRTGRHNLCLDFGGVQFVSSDCLGKLISLNKKMNTAGRHLILCNLDPLVYEVFEVTRLTSI